MVVSLTKPAEAWASIFDPQHRHKAPARAGERATLYRRRDTRRGRSCLSLTLSVSCPQRVVVVSDVLRLLSPIGRRCRGGKSGSSCLPGRCRRFWQRIVVPAPKGTSQESTTSPRRKCFQKKERGFILMSFEKTKPQISTQKQISQSEPTTRPHRTA